MTRIVLSFIVLATTLALALPAQAQNGTLTRSFVSSSGVDTNPCTVTEPCATFAQAYTAIGNNGIIAALDPGKYGPLTNITTGVTINGNGWSAITAPANGVGITINAGSDSVTLIGLEIDGAQAAYDGIMLNSAGNLTVTNCTLQNFVYSGSGVTTGTGIMMQQTSGTLYFTITNTTVSGSGYAGISYIPPSGYAVVKGVIDHVVADGNYTGIDFYTGDSSDSTTVVTISNSIASNNAGAGIALTTGDPSTLYASIDNVSASGNNTGVDGNGNANLLLGRSVITGNLVGVANTTSSNTFYSLQNNVILNNISSNGYSSLSTTQSLH